MDEPAEEHIWQLEEETVIAHFDHHGAKDLWIFCAYLSLKELQLLHLHRFVFGIGGDTFGNRNMFRDVREISHAGTRAAPGASFRESAVDHQVGVAPNGAGKVGIVIFGQTKMTERLSRITSALQAFE